MARPNEETRQASEKEGATMRTHSFVAVSGESFHQDVLGVLSAGFMAIGRIERNFDATLRPEPDNQHDRNAIAVTTADGTKIGYLPRDLAKQFAPVIRAAKQPITLPAELTGGDEERSMIGVVLNFAEVYALADVGRPPRPSRSVAPSPATARPSRAATAPATASNVPAGFILPIFVMLIGFFTMLISTQPGASRLIAVPGWLISWVGLALGLKGHSAVVRVGGAFVLSLLMMALAVSCG